jgi:3,4-dihydroxy 2-butanone 4-phosphate synthase/GTP cyclohydrolase II
MSDSALRFDPIEDAIADIKAGKMIILVDDDDRENEGDLVCAAEKVTPEIVNFMATHARGLICLALDSKRTEQLNLPLMVAHNETEHGTNFTVSIEAATGVTTGISAADRAHTILTAMQPSASSNDLVRPGHIFPLRANEGGVLKRAGHTEGAVDLSRLAGCRPGGVICEIMNPDGTMARYPELREFADLHGMRLSTIADLIEYRKQHESFVSVHAEATMPTEFGSFNIFVFHNELDAKDYVALVKGQWRVEEPVLVRVHSQCLTGDVFGSQRCDCGPQLQAAMRLVEAEGRGVILYLPQEGRGIGLLNKIKAYRLQEEGMDTVEANHHLGFKDDLRDYGIGAQMLHQLGVRKMRLMTNNPRKIVGIEGHGLEVVERVSLETENHDHNTDYLRTKQEKLGHLLSSPPSSTKTP